MRANTKVLTSCGYQRPDFATFEVSLINNFMMMFGNFPEDWAGMEFATPLSSEVNHPQGRQKV